MSQNAQTAVNNIYTGPVTNNYYGTPPHPDNSNQGGATPPPPGNKCGAGLFVCLIIGFMVWVVKPVVTPMLLPLLTPYMAVGLADFILTMGFCAAGYFINPKLRKLFKYLSE